MERAQLEQKIAEWCDKLTELEKAKYENSKCNFAVLYGEYYYPQYNKKYIRIVKSAEHQHGAGCVFAFLDYDGNIYKPAGWATPAKTVRGHIDNPPMRSSELYLRG